jgi:hypothetical protein
MGATRDGKAPVAGGGVPQPPRGLVRRFMQAMIGKERMATLDALLPLAAANQQFIAENEDLLRRMRAGEELSSQELAHLQEQLRGHLPGPEAPDG